MNLTQIDSKKETFPKSINALIDQLQTGEHPKPSDIINIVESCNISENDLQEWAHFDHPSEDSYGRKLVYKAPNFEVMVMSWNPGDFSAIHDHGHTTWGAVQVFGENEHATFRVVDGEIYTLTRTEFEYGQVAGVGHHLIHQMGNNTDNKVISLHVYGLNKEKSNITGDARLYNLEKGVIEIVNGGVFYNLPKQEVASTIEGPTPDYPTRLRDQIELAKRIEQADPGNEQINEIVRDISSYASLEDLRGFLDVITDVKNHVSDSRLWGILIQELKEAGAYLSTEGSKNDSFHKYAEMYDSLICAPCYDSFMEDYISFFVEKYIDDITTKDIISLGCGTGLIEEKLIQKFNLPNENVYGIDFSQSMVNEARNRISADPGNILELDPGIRKWDIAYSGLNVYQYLDCDKIEEAISKTAAIINPEGYFVGDFITPDHVRWYPNVMFSPSKKIISFRSPELIEISGKMFQESEIINLDFTQKVLSINYAGKHKRFLVPIHRMRAYFEKYFSEVKLYDAISLEEISPTSDTCASTRYFIVAKA